MMSATLETRTRPVPQYAGLRMSSDDYHALENDGFKYELVNGLIILSPSPRPVHQKVLAELLYQLQAFVRTNPIGNVYPETDVTFDRHTTYRPELVFVRRDRVEANWRRIRDAPDLAVEVVSPENRRYDTETKRADYERFGVREYWVIDPEREMMSFFRLVDGRYQEIAPSGGRFASDAVPGFVLDLAAVRAAFKPL